MKRFFLLLVLAGIACHSSYAQSVQSADICTAMNAIIRDAPNQFRNIKGRMISSDMNSTIWASGIAIPGSLGTRFVASMGLFYECAFYQTTVKENLMPEFERYKDILNACLVPQGYKQSLLPNFYKGLESYKKVVFTLEPRDSPKLDTIKGGKTVTMPPAHVAMEVDYSKDNGKYTIVMYIFEH